MSDLKDTLFEILKQNEKCHRAEMSLWLEENRVQFSWCPSDFKYRKKTAKMHVSDVLSDHAYHCKHDVALAEDHDNDDVNYSEIYDMQATGEKDTLENLFVSWILSVFLMRPTMS